MTGRGPGQLAERRLRIERIALAARQAHSARVQSEEMKPEESAAILAHDLRDAWQMLRGESIRVRAQLKTREERSVIARANVNARWRKYREQLH